MARLPDDPPSLLPPDAVVLAPGPLVRALVEGTTPTGAIAAARVDASPDVVFKVLEEVDRLPARIPMVHKVEQRGQHLDMQLRFRVALFAAKFGFRATMEVEPGRSLSLHYVSGHPRDLSIRFDVLPLEDGATVVYVSSAFDIDSLGWLVSSFLRHHPEIRLGVHPGSVLTLLDAVQSAVREGA